MKQLTEKELTTKIEAFTSRKFAQYPDVNAKAPSLMTKIKVGMMNRRSALPQADNGAQYLTLTKA